MIRLAQKADSEDVYRLICALEQTALPRKMFDQLFAAQTERDLALVWDEGGLNVPVSGARRPAVYRSSCPVTVPVMMRIDSMNVRA